MIKQMVVVFSLLLGLTLVACGGEEYPTDEAPMPVPADVFGKADAPDCTFLKCTLCPVTAPECHQICIYKGKCPTRCQVVEICNDGFEWSEAACRCIPDVP